MAHLIRDSITFWAQVVVRLSNMQLKIAQPCAMPRSKLGEGYASCPLEILLTIVDLWQATAKNSVRSRSTEFSIVSASAEGLTATMESGVFDHRRRQWLFDPAR